MSGTLYGQLNAIENLSDNVTFDKKKGYLEIFESWRQRNSLVENVVRGERTFSTEFKNIYEMIGEEKSFLPFYLNSEDKKRLEDISQCIGYSLHDYSNNFETLSLNPIGVAAGVVSITSLFTIGPLYKMDRRGFLKLVASFGLVGGIFGGIISLNREAVLEILEENASYLDTKVKELYKLELIPAPLKPLPI